MEKIPDHVVILGRKVKIEQVEGLSDDGNPCIGLCDCEKKILYVEKNLPEDVKLETLVHECVHYFLELTGIAQKLTESETEIYCQLFSAFYFDLKHDI